MIEVLVATVLLITAAMFAIPFFHKSLNIVKRIENKSKCEAVFQGALALIEAGGPDKYRTPVNQGTKIQKGMWLPKPQNIANRNQDVFQMPNDEIIRNRFRVLTGHEHLYQVSPLAGATDPENSDGVTLYTPLLISGPMGYLGDLYLDRNNCRDFQPAPDLNALANFPDAQKLEFLIKVQRQEIESGNLRACDADGVPFWPRARNQQSKSSADSIIEPYTDLLTGRTPQKIARWPDWMKFDDGFLVTLKARFMVAPETYETCEVERSYRVPQDFQNVVDYTKDIKVLSGTTVVQQSSPGVPVDQPFGTTLLSNKKDPGWFATVPDSLKPIFTNYYKNNGLNVTERPVCSQDGTLQQKFTLRLDIANLEAEPGSVVVCMDTSLNHMETADGNPYLWCSKGGSNTARASVQIAPDKQKLKKGWVPCELLRVCGEKPVHVQTTFSTPTLPGAKQNLRYEWDYVFKNGTNQEAQPSHLWGCEMAYRVAVVDPAGNLSYIRDQGLTTELTSQIAITSTPVLAPSAIKVIEPKIYFRPPPCYSCSCKPCKGGLFGSFFRWILILVVLIGFGLIGLALCLGNAFGNCFGGGGYSPPDFSSAAFLSCDGSNQNPPCKCGSNCQKKNAAGPTWLDPIDPNDVNAQPPKNCAPTARTLIDNGISFKAYLSYKKQEGTGYVYDMNRDVAHGDRVSWQQKDATSSCFAVHECYNGVFVLATESYNDSLGVSKTAPMIGCGKLKTAHKILWGQNSDLKKPDVGAPVCLEPEYGQGVANPDGSPLPSHSSVDYECGNDLNPNDPTKPPSFSADPTQRVVGVSVPNACSIAITVDGFNYRPGTKVPISVNDGAGGTTFSCWTKCNLPFKTPLPSSKTEMRYYETFVTGDLALPLCQNLASEVPAGSSPPAPVPLDVPF